MTRTALDLLPPEIAARSISRNEIVLPLPEALKAVDIMERDGIAILGWEGWIRTEDGRVGHGDAPQGTASLEQCAVAQAAEICRRTMTEEAAEWESGNKGSSDRLYFCITVRAW